MSPRSSVSPTHHSPLRALSTRAPAGLSADRRRVTGPRQGGGGHRRGPVRHAGLARVIVPRWASLVVAVALVVGIAPPAAPSAVAAEAPDTAFSCEHLWAGGGFGDTALQVVATQYLSLDGDGQDDTVSYAYCVSGITGDEVWVEDIATGRVVRLLGSHSYDWRADPVMVSGTWDGTDPAGRPLPVGEYSIRVKLWHPAAPGTLPGSETLTFPVEIQVSALGPAIDNFPGNPFTGTTLGSGFDLWQPWLRAGAGAGGSNGRLWATGIDYAFAPIMMMSGQVAPLAGGDAVSPLVSPLGGEVAPVGGGADATSSGSPTGGLPVVPAIVAVPASASGTAFVGSWFGGAASRLVDSSVGTLQDVYRNVPSNATSRGLAIDPYRGPLMYTWSFDAADYWKTAPGHPAEFTDASLGHDPDTGAACAPTAWSGAQSGSWVAVRAYSAGETAGTVFWVPNPRAGDAMSEYKAAHPEYPGTYDIPRDPAWNCQTTGTVHNYDDGWAAAAVMPRTGRLFFVSRATGGLSTTFRAMVFDPATGAFAESGRLKPATTGDDFFNGAGAQVAGGVAVDASGNAYIMAQGQAPAGSPWADPDRPGEWAVYILRITPANNPAYLPTAQGGVTLPYLHNGSWTYSVVQRLTPAPSEFVPSSLQDHFLPTTCSTCLKTGALKGLAILNDQLYTADSNYLYRIDPLTGLVYHVPQGDAAAMVGLTGAVLGSYSDDPKFNTLVNYFDDANVTITGLAGVSAQSHIEVSAIERGGVDYAHLTWPAPFPSLAPGGATSLTGYEVWVRRALDSGDWALYGSVPPQADGSGSLDIPATERARGRYYTVVATYSDGARAGGYDIGTGPANYAALGDSFSSGEGVPPFEMGTADDVDQYGGNACHRSFNSYSRLLSIDRTLGLALDPATFAACSGAIAADMAHPNSSNSGEPAQNTRVNQFTDLITLTMGGNDIDFSTIGMICVAADCSAFLRDERNLAEGKATTGGFSGLFSTIAEVFLGIQRKQAGPETEWTTNSNFLYGGKDSVLVQRLTTVYTDLATRAPNAQILVLPYPQLAGGLSGSGHCYLGVDSASALDLMSLDADERVEIARLIDTLNADVALAVAQANEKADGRITLVNPVDVDHEFGPGQLCRDGGFNPDTYVNTITLPADGFGSGVATVNGRVTYSFHPNALGHQAYERALRRYVAPVLATILPHQWVDLPGTFVGTSLAALRFEANWPGSTVALSVIGPDGTVYDANSPGVTVGGDATSAWLEIANPGPGRWAPRLYGADVAPEGEDVRVRVAPVEREAPSPTAAVEVSPSVADARTVTFDAAGSTAAQGELTYSWYFADDETASGATVTHTFAADVPIRAQLRLDDGVSIPTWATGAINAAPVAVDDALGVTHDSELTVAAPGVLGNDSDLDGDPLAAVLDEGPAHGTVALNRDGGYVYTPAAGFVGTDSFTYHAADGLADSALATVALAVGEPVAPVVSSVSPGSGQPFGGTLVTVSGRGFAGATAVAFGEAPATRYLVLTDSQIVALAPAGDTGPVAVRVTTPAGTNAATPGACYAYSDGATEPSEGATAEPCPAPAETPTADPGQTATSSPTPVESATPSATSTPDDTPATSQAPIASVTPTPDATETLTPAETPSGSPTAAETGTPAQSASPSLSPSESVEPTPPAETAAPTEAPTPSESATPSATPSASPTPSPTPTPTGPSLGVAPASATVAAAGGEVTFAVTSDDPWTLDGLPEWAHASAVAGPAGTTEVTLTVDGWSGSAARQATLTVSSAGQTVAYTLDQAANMTAWWDQLVAQLREFIARLLSLVNQLLAILRR